MQQRKIGTRTVGAIGFGSMWLAKWGRPSDEQGIATIHAALDAGVTLIDTADAYCLDDTDTGHGERLIARALREYGGRTDHVLVATKGGWTRPGGRWVCDGRPEHLRAACEASLRALGVDVIDLYQLHHPDHKVPFEETIGAMADLQREGKVRMVGLSNVSLAQIDVAQRLVEIVSVQNMFNPWHRVDETNGLLAACQERGIAYLAYSPLGGGGRGRYVGELPGIAAVAKRRGISPQRVVLAWLLATSPVMIPIPGGRRIKSIWDNVAAASVTLDDAELAAIAQMGRPIRWATMNAIRWATRNDPVGRHNAVMSDPVAETRKVLRGAARRSVHATRRLAGDRLR